MFQVLCSPMRVVVVGEIHSFSPIPGAARILWAPAVYAVPMSSIVMFCGSDFFLVLSKPRPEYEVRDWLLNDYG